MVTSAQELAGMLQRPTSAAEQARQTVPRAQWLPCKDPKCGEVLDPLWWDAGVHPTCCDPATLSPVPTSLTAPAATAPTAAQATYPPHVIEAGGPDHYAATQAQILDDAIHRADWDTVVKIAKDDFANGDDRDKALGALAGAMATERSAEKPSSPFTAPAGPKTHPLKQQFIDLIRWAAADLPRSRQTAVGPSEIGVDCMRRLAYRYAGTAACNDTADPWFSIVGTAVHDWLAVALDNYNTKVLGPPNGTRSHDQRRYRVEDRVTATSDQFGVSGSSDVFDEDLGAVIDWKVVGPTALKKYRDSGPSNQYRIQVHTYGKGQEEAGRTVRQVVIVFLPRSGYLTDTHVWSEPYDRQIAIDALNRAATVKQLAAVLPPAAIPAVADPAMCTWCPFYRPGGPADTTGCPGPLKSPDATARR